jgi:hypothetical protein
MEVWAEIALRRVILVRWRISIRGHVLVNYKLKGQSVIGDTDLFGEEECRTGCLEDNIPFPYGLCDVYGLTCGGWAKTAGWGGWPYPASRLDDGRILVKAGVLPLFSICSNEAGVVDEIEGVVVVCRTRFTSFVASSDHRSTLRTWYAQSHLESLVSLVP